MLTAAAVKESAFCNRCSSHTDRVHAVGSIEAASDAVRRSNTSTAAAAAVERKTAVRDSAETVDRTCRN